jgi:hypothetical protein
VDELLQRIFGSAVTRLTIAVGILGGVGLVIRQSILHLVEKRVDLQFGKQLASHKSELEHVLESHKSDLQRRLAAEGLYMQRQHEGAARAYRAIRKAHGAVADLFGIHRPVTLRQDLNLADLQSVLDSYEIYGGKQEQILAAWRDSPAKGNKLFSDHMFNMRLPRAQRALTTARNLMYLNELYFSDATILAFEEFNDACIGWTLRVEFPPERGDRIEERPDLDEPLKVVRLAMRAELTDPSIIAAPKGAHRAYYR